MSNLIMPEPLLLPSEKIEKMGWKDQKTLKIEKNNFQYLDKRAEYIDGVYLYRNCYVQVWNRLLLPDGMPMSAKSLAYYFSGIQWCPGYLWPTYSERCPRPDYSGTMTYPTAKRHQLIVQFGGHGWFECSNSGAGKGDDITDVFVGVNDDKFDDNTGKFDFIVSAYGR